MLAIPIDHRTFEILTDLNNGVRPQYDLEEDTVFIYHDRNTPPEIISYNEFVEKFPDVKTFKIGYLK